VDHNLQDRGKGTICVYIILCKMEVHCMVVGGKNMIDTNWLAVLYKNNAVVYLQTMNLQIQNNINQRIKLHSYISSSVHKNTKTMFQRYDIFRIWFQINL